MQYGDFLFVAMDQIVSNAASMRYMSGGRAEVPIVMRAPVGATGRGSQHAHNMERFFTGVPGLKVVAPSNAYDAKGLLKAASLQGPDPDDDGGLEVPNRQDRRQPYVLLESIQNIFGNPYPHFEE